jgi:hypothetical protein
MMLHDQPWPQVNLVATKYQKVFDFDCEVARSTLLVPTYFVCALQITGQSCPLSLKGSLYWMAPEVRMFLFLAWFP